VKDQMAPTRLTTAAHFEAADDFYEALIEVHQGLASDESHALNARLVLVLANHIGSMAVLREALMTARNGNPDDNFTAGSVDERDLSSAKQSTPRRQK